MDTRCRKMLHVDIRATVSPYLRIALEKTSQHPGGISVAHGAPDTGHNIILTKVVVNRPRSASTEKVVQVKHISDMSEAV